MVDKYTESPFVTEEILKRWIENEFKKLTLIPKSVDTKKLKKSL